MKRSAIVLFILLALSSVMVIASNSQSIPSTAHRAYQLSITSVPPGAYVYIDGVYRGRTPLQLSLWHGTYTLTLEMSGYRVYEERLLLDRNINKSVYLQRAVRTHRLTINSYPSRAEVYIGGRYVGRTPLSISLDEGSHDVLLRLSGYWDYSERVRLTSDRYMDITLTPDWRPVHYRASIWLGDIPLERLLLLSLGLLFVVLALMY